MPLEAGRVNETSVIFEIEAVTRSIAATFTSKRAQTTSTDDDELPSNCVSLYPGVP